MNDNIVQILRQSKGRLTYFITIAIMVIMPVHNKLLPPFMVLLLLSWFIDNYPLTGAFGDLSPRFRSLFILFLLFFLWQIFSLVYSSDIRLGLLNVFGRVSLLIFPLIFFSPGEEVKAKRTNIIRIFAISTSFYLVTCYIFALYRSISFLDGTLIFNPHPPEYGWLNYFYSLEFTYSIHPSYLAMYVLLSIIIALDAGSDYSLSIKCRTLWFILSGFLTISVYFISSRAAILAVIPIIFLYSGYKIVMLKNSRYIWIGIIVIMVLALPLLLKNERVSHLINGFKKENKVRFKKHDDRIIVWESALRRIQMNPVFGVGIGDARTELANEYNRIGADKLVREKLNAHNQFLEILLETGIIGLTLLLLILGYMIFLAYTDKNIIYGLYILIIVIFFMFESILYRFAGISFFSLFSFVLLQNPVKNKI